LIKYARCFATGKRFGLSKDVFQNLQGEPFKAHQFYIDLRNKHIAHSANPIDFKDNEPISPGYEC